MTKGTTTTGLVSIVMVMAVTGVYLTKHHQNSNINNKENSPHSGNIPRETKELPAEIPLIIKIDSAEPIDDSVLYNKIVRSIKSSSSTTSRTTAIDQIGSFTKGNNTNPNLEGVQEVLPYAEKVVVKSRDQTVPSVELPAFQIGEKGDDIQEERRNKIKEVLSGEDVLETNLR